MHRPNMITILYTKPDNKFIETKHNFQREELPWINKFSYRQFNQLKNYMNFNPISKWSINQCLKGLFLSKECSIHAHISGTWITWVKKGYMLSILTTETKTPQHVHVCHSSQTVNNSSRVVSLAKVAIYIFTKIITK